MATQVEHIKWVPGTNFIVDGFAFQSPKCRHYFLSHCHSDHTIGLRRSFAGGTIYCSEVSARLLVHDMGIPAECVRALELGVAVEVEGVRVTPLDANHCPGSVMFLFEVPEGGADLPLAGPGPHSRQQPSPKHEQQSQRAMPTSAAAGSGGGGTSRRAGLPAAAAAAGPEVSARRHTILHTGDCRWQGWMALQRGLAGKRVDTLFLDTTYAHPRHAMPPQEEAVASMVQVMREALAEEPLTAFLVAAYHIGKERAYMGAAQQLGCKVFCSPAKRKVLALLALPEEQMALLTDDPRVATIHVDVWGMRDHEQLQAFLEQHQGRWRRVMAIRPTGWTYRRSAGGRPSVWREGDTAIVGVPYSEHSSWDELCDAVAALRPRRLVPTVNASTPERSRELVDRFAPFMDLSRDRSRLDLYMHAGPRLPRRVDLASVDVQEQQRLWAEVTQQHRASACACSQGGDGGAEGAASSKLHPDVSLSCDPGRGVDGAVAGTALACAAAQLLAPPGAVVPVQGGARSGRKRGSKVAAAWTGASGVTGAKGRDASAGQPSAGPAPPAKRLRRSAGSAPASGNSPCPAASPCGSANPCGGAACGSERPLGQQPPARLLTQAGRAACGSTTTTLVQHCEVVDLTLCEANEGVGSACAAWITTPAAHQVVTHGSVSSSSWWQPVSLRAQAAVALTQRSIRSFFTKS